MPAVFGIAGEMRQLMLPTLHREEKLIDLRIFITRASTRWSYQLDQFILNTNKFALCLAINETHALYHSSIPEDHCQM